VQGLEAGRRGCGGAARRGGGFDGLSRTLLVNRFEIGEALFEVAHILNAGLAKLEEAVS
jgi:hypothetical protein